MDWDNNPKGDLYEEWLHEWKVRTYFAISHQQRYKILKRPSWLRPIKRVLWVHHHGPHTPKVKVPIGNPRRMGVLTGVTS